MFQTIKNKAINAKTAAGALVLSAATSPAFAQSAGQSGNTGAEIVTSVQAALASGASIATAVVLGLFAIWGIKLLWRSK